MTYSGGKKSWQILLRTGAVQDDQEKHFNVKAGYCTGFHYQTENLIQSKFWNNRLWDQMWLYSQGLLEEDCRKLIYEAVKRVQNHYWLNFNASDVGKVHSYDNEEKQHFERLETIKQIAYGSFGSIQLPSSVQRTGGRLLSPKVFQLIQQKEEELRDRPIGNQDKEEFVKSEKS